MSDELCGAWMPVAKEYCIRGAGHKDNHKSSKAVKARRIRRARAAEIKVKELCGAYMPRAKEYCPRTLGHKGAHVTASYLEHDRRRTALRRTDPAKKAHDSEITREVNKKRYRADEEYRAICLTKESARRRSEISSKIVDRKRETWEANKDAVREEYLTRSKNWHRKVRGSVPRGELRNPDFPVWVYALCDDRDRVLYIGQTVNCERRLKGHRAEPHPWRAEIAYLEPLFLTTWTEADEDEKRFIELGGRRLKNETHHSDTDPGYTTIEELKKLL